ncbi:MAG: hypothetical protein R3E64_16960 [Halioglobus sp.]
MPFFVTSGQTSAPQEVSYKAKRLMVQDYRDARAHTGEKHAGQRSETARTDKCRALIHKNIV